MRFEDGLHRLCLDGDEARGLARVEPGGAALPGTHNFRVGFEIADWYHFARFHERKPELLQQIAANGIVCRFHDGFMVSQMRGV